MEYDYGFGYTLEQPPSSLGLGGITASRRALEQRATQRQMGKSSLIQVRRWRRRVRFSQRDGWWTQQQWWWWKGI
jgi:hypothetical protein